nr:MAG TPA: hypothetical protein [Caudoviricetes sp.]
MIKTKFGGFKIKFDNGYTISVINGFGSYSENHLNHKLFEKMQNINFKDECYSKNCEVAILLEDMFCTKSFVDCNDSVKAYVTSDELADLIIKVKNAK